MGDENTNRPTQEEIETEMITVYDTCVACLETNWNEGARAYATRMAERGVIRGMARMRKRFTRGRICCSAAGYWATSSRR